MCTWFCLEEEVEHVFKEHISFLPSLSAHRCYSRETATTQPCRNQRFCCFLLSLMHLYSLVTQKFLSFPPWDLFSGPYWKHYQRKLGASDPSPLCFTVWFLLCLWFSLDLLQLWFILVSCSGICWVSLHILCILLCYYISLLWIVIFRWLSVLSLSPEYWFSRSQSEMDSRSAQQLLLDSGVLAAFFILLKNSLKTILVMSR